MSYLTPDFSSFTGIGSFVHDVVAELLPNIAGVDYATPGQIELKAPGGTVRIGFGSALLTWPAGVAYSNPGTVAHGLGRTPAYVGGFVAHDDPGELGLRAVTLNTAAPADTLNVYLQGVFTFAGATAHDRTCYWFALA